MGGKDELPEEVAEILRQFPGPIMFWPTKFRSIGICVAIPLMVALLAYFAFSAAEEGSVIETIAFGLCGLILAAAEIAALFVLLTGSSFMRLTTAGFEIRYAWSVNHHAWHDVAGFAVRTIGRTPVVAYEDAAGASRPTSALDWLLQGRTSTLGQTYGLKLQDMARLMNEWRKLALTRGPP